MCDHIAKEINSNHERKYKTGRWTSDEHRRFIEAILKYGNEWRKVQKHVGTRSSTQARSHAQKFFAKVKRSGNEGEIDKELLKNLEELNESSLDVVVPKVGKKNSTVTKSNGIREKKTFKTSKDNDTKNKTFQMSEVETPKRSYNSLQSEQIKQNTTDSFLSTNYFNNKSENGTQPIIINNNIKHFNININNYDGFDMLSYSRPSFNYNESFNNFINNNYNPLAQLNSKLTIEQEFQNNLDEMFKCDRFSYADNRNEMDLLESFENNFINNRNNNFSSFLTSNRKASFDAMNPLSFDNLNK